MATLKIRGVSRKGDWAHTCRYAVLPEKTSAYAAMIHGFHREAVWMKNAVELKPDPRQLHYASAVGFTNVDRAPEVYRETWQRFVPRHCRNAVYHIIQSFDPADEVTAEVAHEIGRTFVKEVFPGAQAVVGTHFDRPHMHNHLVVNNLRPTDGRPIRSQLEEGLYTLHAASNRLCESYGLSRLDSLDRERFGRWTYVNRRALERDLNFIRSRTEDPEEMLEMLRSFRHEVSEENGILWVLPEGAPQRIRLPDFEDWPVQKERKPHVFRNLEGLHFRKATGLCTLLEAEILQYAVLLSSQCTDRIAEVSFREYKKLNTVLDTLHYVSDHQIENMQQLETELDELRQDCSRAEQILSRQESEKRALHGICRAVCVTAFPAFYTPKELASAAELLRGRSAADIQQVQEVRLMLEAQLIERVREFNALRDQVATLRTFRNLEPQMRKALSHQQNRRRERLRSAKTRSHCEPLQEMQQPDLEMER